ncbi:cinnamyl alcohol dehydrogenase [Streptomyces sp. NPDC006798]|uniref:cinnamyl alcohol dehydrogenase n=1 Tax=Streptomyces sp. NPDC006798 TaxID=3155462 RepID=UPI003411A82A
MSDMTGAAAAGAEGAGVESAGVEESMGAAAAGPTAGWKRTKFTFKVQRPWDREEVRHYKLASDTHTLRVHSTDEPFEQGSRTDPRAEMRWNEEYSTGRHMWDGDVFLKRGSDGATFVQILRTKRPEGSATTDFMLNVYDQDGGTVKLYSRRTIATGMYERWFNVKIAHDATAGTIKVWFDDKPVYSGRDEGRVTARHFKNGLYHHGEGLAQVQFRNLTYWTR